MIEKEPTVKEQVAQIKHEVELNGECFATCETLRVLCKDQGTFSHQMDRVTGIALQEGWSFAFLNDGTVRFTSPAAKVTDEFKPTVVPKRASVSTMSTNKAPVMSWWCPTCGEKISEPLAFFLSPPCHCPLCQAVMNMDGLHRVIAAAETDGASSAS